MSLTDDSSLESARRKFFVNSTYIMSRKLESNVFGLRRPKSLTNSSSNRREENFLNSTYIMSRKESNVFGLRRPK